MRLQASDECGELRMVVDGRFDLCGLDEHIVIAGAVGFEQSRSQLRADRPIITERIDVPRRDAAVQMTADVLDILGFLGIDIARQIEIEVVLRDLVMRHQPRIAGVCFRVGEDVDDLMQIALTQPVLGAVLNEALAGIDHEDALADGGVVLVEHENAGGNAGAVEEIGRQADDALEKAGANELGADHGLGATAKQHAVGQNAGAFACALERADDVQQIGVIALLRRRLAPLKALEGIDGRRQPGSPGLVGERRIGDHIIIGAELLAILELGRSERIAREDIRRRKIMQNHVHAGETGGGHVLFLPLQRDVLARLCRDLQQQRAGAAGGIISRGGRHGISGRNADHLGDDPTDFGRGIKLTLALAAFGSKVPHQIFVGIAKDVVIVSTVLRKIQFPASGRCR